LTELVILLRDRSSIFLFRLGGLEVLEKEVGYHLVHFGIAEAVAAILDDVEGRLNTGGLEGIVEDLALVERNQRVFVAVDDQERRSLRVI
jgi:hypothetical protein